MRQKEEMAIEIVYYYNKQTVWQRGTPHRRLLANHLGIPLYDKQLFTESSRRSNIHESFFVNAESDGSRYFAHAFDSAVGGRHLPLNDRVFIEQTHTIRELAERG